MQTTNTASFGATSGNKVADAAFFEVRGRARNFCEIKSNQNGRSLFLPTQALNDEEKLRYYLVTRTRVSPEVVARVVAPLLPPPSALSPASLTGPLWALSGGVKPYALQLCESAKAVADGSGHVGPLKPAHLVEAWRRMAAEGRAGPPQ